MDGNQKYWFASQRYGAVWGYGRPIAWQGWVATVLYYAFIVAGLFVVSQRGWLICLTFAAVSSGLFFLFLKWKGAPPAPTTEIL